jgi:hypothetical protein
MNMVYIKQKEHEIWFTQNRRNMNMVYIKQKEHEYGLHKTEGT